MGLPAHEGDLGVLGRHPDPERSRRGRIPVFVFVCFFVRYTTLIFYGLKEEALPALPMAKLT